LKEPGSLYALLENIIISKFDLKIPFVVEFASIIIA
jgi:hypothetical protein